MSMIMALDKFKFLNQNPLHKYDDDDDTDNKEDDDNNVNESDKCNGGKAERGNKCDEGKRKENSKGGMTTQEKNIKQ